VQHCERASCTSGCAAQVPASSRSVTQKRFQAGDVSGVQGADWRALGCAERHRLMQEAAVGHS
jgi:hypothetical protein